MGNLISKSPQAQDSEIYVKNVYGRIVILGTNVAADIKAYAEEDTTFYPFVETNVQPTAAIAAVDNAANLPTLDSNAAPSKIGLIVAVGDAKRLLRVEILPLSISSGTMTAGVVALADLYGASNTGVSTNKNICLAINTTGLQIDAGVATTKFGVWIQYIIDRNV